jgi:hypothetical protein
LLLLDKLLLLLLPPAMLSPPLLLLQLLQLPRHCCCCWCRTSLTAMIWPLAFFTRLSFLRKYLQQHNTETVDCMQMLACTCVAQVLLNAPQ